MQYPKPTATEQGLVASAESNTCEGRTKPLQEYEPGSDEFWNAWDNREGSPNPDFFPGDFIEEQHRMDRNYNRRPKCVGPNPALKEEIGSVAF